MHRNINSKPKKLPIFKQAIENKKLVQSIISDILLSIAKFSDFEPTRAKILNKQTVIEAEMELYSKHFDKYFKTPSADVNILSSKIPFKFSSNAFTFVPGRCNNFKAHLVPPTPDFTFPNLNDFK